MLNVIIKELRGCFRSGSNLFFSILFPSILVFFLGTFLEEIEDSDESIGELNIVYSVDNAAYEAAVPFEKFIDALENKSILTAKKTSSDKLEIAVSESCSAAVELSGSDIIIYCGTDAIKNRTVKALFDGYDRTACSYMAVASVDPAALANTQMSEESFVKHKDLGASRTMMDYYAVAMTVMIVFMGSCLSGATVYSDEYKSNTIDRLGVSPVRPSAVFLGKIIGSVPLAFIQVVTVMITSTLLFGAHYCNSFSGNLLLAILFIATSLAALSVGVIINLFFPKLPSTLVLMPILWVLMFYSGTFSQDIYIEGFSDKLPMYVIQKAAFDLTLFSRTEKAISVITVSMVIFAVLLIIGIIRVNIRRKDV